MELRIKPDMLFLLLILQTGEVHHTRYYRSGYSATRPGALGRLDADIQCMCTALLALNAYDSRSPDDENTRAVLGGPSIKSGCRLSDRRLQPAVTVEFGA
jgi:hypothetical protein